MSWMAKRWLLTWRTRVRIPPFLVPMRLFSKLKSYCLLQQVIRNPHCIVNFFTFSIFHDILGRFISHKFAMIYRVGFIVLQYSAIWFGCLVNNIRLSSFFIRLFGFGRMGRSLIKYMTTDICVVTIESMVVT